MIQFIGVPENVDESIVYVESKNILAQDESDYTPEYIVVLLNIISNQFRNIAIIREYIAVYYNAKRLHSSLGYMTPVEFEKCA